MDYLHQQNNSNNVPKKNFLKRFFFLEIGILEVGFILLLLLFVFGILNYFNILQVGKVLPFLSFLPHKTTSQQVATQKFARDEALVSQLRTFINQTMNPQYSLPSETPFQQGKIGNFSYTEGIWDKNNTEITSHLQGDNSFNQLLFEKTTISLGTASAQLDTTTANNFFQKYFIVDTSQLSFTACRTETNTFYSTCELQTTIAGFKVYYNTHVIGRSNSLFITVCHPFQDSAIPDCNQL